MTLVQAILLGIVQGLTEFLPISSTAHLRIVPALCGWGDPGSAFTAVIQWGTLIAVVIYFAGDIWNILRAVIGGIIQGKPLASNDARMGWMIVAGTIPIVVCGLLFKQQIRTTLRNLYVIVAALVGLALLLMLAEYLLHRRQQAGHSLKSLDDLGWLDALGVGLAQAVALVPGSSRSGVTITGGLFLGLNRETAARFSFLLSLPSVLAAGVLELYEQRDVLLASTESTVNLATATIFSFLSGYAAIAFLMAYLRRHTTFLFIVYRLLLGGLLFALLQMNVIPAE
jgi:undecaprenyl-diphosphatase